MILSFLLKRVALRSGGTYESLRLIAEFDPHLVNIFENKLKIAVKEDGWHLSIIKNSTNFDLSPKVRYKIHRHSIR